MFYVYVSLENGVSQATRYAVTGNTMDDPDNPGPTLSAKASIKAAMRQATPTITIPDTTFTFSHMAPAARLGSAAPAGPATSARSRSTTAVDALDADPRAVSDQRQDDVGSIRP